MREGGYDAVVSDYQMSEMDGIEFLKHFRKEHPSLPFIIFTGRGREEIAIAAFESGADSYIQKGGDPIAQFAELSHKIRKSVEQRKSDEALGRARRNFATCMTMLRTGTIPSTLTAVSPSATTRPA